MFRHVVLFKWSDEASAALRDSAVAALETWADAAADYGVVTVGTDVGLREGNFDVAVVAEFPDSGSYQRYAADERHQDLLREHITPLVAGRAAVQHEL